MRRHTKLNEYYWMVSISIAIQIRKMKYTKSWAIDLIGNYSKHSSKRYTDLALN